MVKMRGGDVENRPEDALVALVETVEDCEDSED